MLEQWISMNKKWHVFTICDGIGFVLELRPRTPYKNIVGHEFIVTNNGLKTSGPIPEYVRRVIVQIAKQGNEFFTVAEKEVNNKWRAWK